MKKSISLCCLLGCLCLLLSVLVSCGNTPACTHTYGSAVVFSDDDHQSVCTKCGAKKTESHAWESDPASLLEENAKTIRQTCSVCSAERQIDNESYDAWQAKLDGMTYPWTEEENLVFSVCDSSNGGDLESGGKAFISGEWTTELVRTGETVSSVDSGILKQILQRNATSSAVTNTTLTYRYMTEGYAAVMPKMVTEASAADTPDLYFNIIYDLVGASVKGLLANIQGNDYLGCFWNEYDAKEDSRGYNWQFMNDLTFSAKYMYLIASDFSFDIARSYLVMPVSLKLLGNATEVTGDVDKDGEAGTTDDLYAMIQNGEWTWSKILEYTEEVKKPDSKKGGYALNGSDCIAGFAMSTKSGLSPTALLYTSSMQIFTREIDETTGEYVYSCPDEAPASLVNACNVLYDVVVGIDGQRNQLSDASKGTTGVIIFDGKSPETQPVFTQNRLFVDAAIMLGCIEKKMFQDMWDEDTGSMGFAVAPVAKLTKEASYQTMIPNIGRVVGISAKSGHVDAACAYLNYATSLSTPILEEYYEWVIGYGRAVTEANVEILMDMKDQILYSHDKVIEDTLGMLYNSEMVNNPVGSGTIKFGDCRWHIYVMQYWRANTISQLYAGVYQNKLAKVNEIQSDFITNATK